METTTLSPAERAVLLARRPKWLGHKKPPSLIELSLRMEAAEALIARQRFRSRQRRQCKSLRFRRSGPIPLSASVQTTGGLPSGQK